VLGTEFDIVGVCTTLSEAISSLHRDVESIVCEIHFDDSRMFDLLRLAKADPATREIPFVCFRDMDSHLAPPFLESLQIACKALGAVAFIDLFDLKARYGTKQADARFREILTNALS